MASTSDLLQITSRGVVVPNFSTIRSKIIAMYKDAYGSDIDLSTGSADGVFVYNLALIMKQLCDTNKIIYGNLDVRTAGGIYLDALCALSNVMRKQPTRSNATIIVTNIGDSPITLNNTLFADQDGQTWQFNGTVTLNAGISVSLFVECTDVGEVKADAGWINQTVEVMNVTVSQPNAANVGSWTETDAELRSRRLQSSAAGGITVVQALVGALLNVSGIDDAKVYNNPGAAVSAQDTTTIEAHSIYAIVRLHEGVTVPDATIGEIIYNKLTPGIGTTAMGAISSGTSKSYTKQAEMLGVALMNANQTVYWKQAIPTATSFTVQITPNSNFMNPSHTPGNPSEYDTICPKIIEWLNNLPIGVAPTSNDIIQKFMEIDPKLYGKRTYQIGLISSLGTNPDTYYNYDKYEVSSTMVPGTYEITFSKEA